jgi:hypothetical protein
LAGLRKGAPKKVLPQVCRAGETRVRSTRGYSRTSIWRRPRATNSRLGARRASGRPLKRAGRLPSYRYVHFSMSQTSFAHSFRKVSPRKASSRKLKSCRMKTLGQGSGTRRDDWAWMPSAWRRTDARGCRGSCRFAGAGGHAPRTPTRRPCTSRACGLRVANSQDFEFHAVAFKESSSRLI